MKEQLVNNLIFYLLSLDIQQFLKNQDVRKKEDITSPLMADVRVIDSEPLHFTQSIPGVFSSTKHEFTVFPNAIGETVLTDIETPSQVSSFEVNSEKSAFNKSGMLNLNPLQVTVLKAHTPHIAISELSISQIAKRETATSQIALSPLNITQVDVPPFGDIRYVATGSKLDSTQGSFTQINFSPIERHKISLPNPIPSQKVFFSHLSHNSSPNSLTGIYKT